MHPHAGDFFLIARSSANGLPKAGDRVIKNDNGGKGVALPH